MGRDAVRLRRAQTRRHRDRRRADRLVPLAPRHLQMPALHRVRDRAEDVDRQDPEIQAAGDGEGSLKTLLIPRAGLQRTPRVKIKTPQRPRFRGGEKTKSTAWLCRLVDELVVPQPHDLVLY